MTQKCLGIRDECGQGHNPRFTVQFKVIGAPEYTYR